MVCKKALLLCKCHKSLEHSMQRQISRLNGAVACVLLKASTFDSHSQHWIDTDVGTVAKFCVCFIKNAQECACRTIVESCKQINLMFSLLLFFKMIRHDVSTPISQLVLSINFTIQYLHCCAYRNVFGVCVSHLRVNQCYNMLLFGFIFGECQRKIWHRLQMSREINRFKTCCQIYTNSKTWW